MSNTTTFDSPEMLTAHFLGRPLNREDTLAHLKAVKVLAAADGLSDTEAWAFRQVMVESGVPADLIKEAEAFDPHGVRLEDVVKAPKGSRRAREVVRGAIRIAIVDGYSELEREMIMQTAWMLGIRPQLVYAFEAIAQLERRVRALEDPKLLALVMPLYHALLDIES